MRNVIICPGFQARKVIKKKLIHRTKRKKIHITADTAHLLNRMGVCVPVHAFQSSILSVCMCVSVCVCVLPKSRNGRRHSSASLNHWHLDQSSGSMQMSYWSVTAWTRPLHFLAYCWSRLTPR